MLEEAIQRMCLQGNKFRSRNLCWLRAPRIESARTKKKKKRGAKTAEKPAAINILRCGHTMSA